jgi:hypothetical protein
MKIIPAYLAHRHHEYASRVFLIKEIAEQWGSDVTQVDIYCNSAEALASVSEVWHVHLSRKPKVARSFYPTKDEATVAARSNGEKNPCVVSITLDQRVTVEGPSIKLPARAIVEKGDNGRLLCRLNGKPYFPNNSCKGIREGAVIVESIKDMGKYGFFVGRMSSGKEENIPKAEENHAPIRAYVTKGRDGKLICHMNGKVYFPDRSCKDIQEGPVVIESIKDMGKYGFFVGRMA